MAPPREKIAAAIIPAYNEGKRIIPALEAITRATLVREVVVVDDGSASRETEAAVRRFPSVRYLRNEVNRGKGYSMDRGVRETSAPLIFFCDADLEGLTPEIVEEAIRPVAEGRCDMTIGIRENLAQRAWRPFALLSGERALRRETWEQLPAFYRHRFRVEAGLNVLARARDLRTCAIQFPYYQTAKERKWGFLRGTTIRWRMNWDVSLAWLRATFIDQFRVRRGARPDGR